MSFAATLSSDCVSEGLSAALDTPVSLWRRGADNLVEQLSRPEHAELLPWLESLSVAEAVAIQPQGETWTVGWHWGDMSFDYYACATVPDARVDREEGWTAGALRRAAQMALQPALRILL